MFPDGTIRENVTIRDLFFCSLGRDPNDGRLVYFSWPLWDPGVATHKATRVVRGSGPL